jgi:hypothetical protein
MAALLIIWPGIFFVVVAGLCIIGCLIASPVSKTSPPPVTRIKNASRPCQMFPGGGAKSLQIEKLMILHELSYLYLCLSFLICTIGIIIALSCDHYEN